MEQVQDYEKSRAAGIPGSNRKISPFDVKKQEAEANMLSKVFHNARQIIFLPLWNAAAGSSPNYFTYRVANISVGN